MTQFLVHYALHLILPGIVAYTFFRNHWKKAYLIMLATMLVDLDHLLASPIFDASRCSINFHPLHSYLAIVLYAILFFLKKFRLVSLGLLLHMMTDFIDCEWMNLS
ncbi:MAG: hypothetical protein HKN48_03465 [Flavobacteriaceae bacterium]|nr:hypothetical protein [Flavobacteriaceae bacterium]